MQVWACERAKSADRSLRIPVNHEEQEVSSGAIIELEAGSRVTLFPVFITNSIQFQMNASLARFRPPTTTCTITFSSIRTLGAILASRKTSHQFYA